MQPKLKKTLFVSRAFPSTFSNSVFGIHQRLRLFLEAAQSISEELTILFFIDESVRDRLDERDYALQLKAEWGVKARIVFQLRNTSARSRWSARLSPVWNVRRHNDLYSTCEQEHVEAVESALTDRTELVVAFGLEVAIPVVAACRERVPVAFDLNDIIHLAFARAILRPPKRLFEYVYLPALYWGERRAIRKSSLAFVCSNSAEAYLRKHRIKATIRVAPNAVEIPARDNDASSIRHSESLLFVGLFSYQPNLDAAVWLIEKIFPAILDSCPNARLLFVGGGIERLAKYGNASANIDFLGFVPSMSDVYARSSVVVAPIRSGGGTRTKIIEAAAYGLPIVSTTLGAEGLDFCDEVEILLRDDSESFAQACVRLLKSSSDSQSLGAEARRKAACYDRRLVVPQIAGFLAEAGRSQQAA